MTLSALAGVLPPTASATADDHLALSGCDVVALADRFGTPLYVYDEATIVSNARAFIHAVDAYPGQGLVCYAAKAYCAPWLLRLVAQLGLGLDVVSGGEIFTAQRSGFPANRVYFHGNNKTAPELDLALAYGVGCIVVDNVDEVQRLAERAAEAGRRQRVLLRVTPGVEAHTHAYVKTGVLDTKFGVSIETGAAEEALRLAMSQPSLDVAGLHTHIGSQIFEIEPFREAIRRVFAFAALMRDRHGFALRELSPGGGYGIRYVPEDNPPAPVETVRAVVDAVTSAATASGFGSPLPHLSIEPGRSVIGPAAVALYRIGSVKVVSGVRTYVAVDGGLADNPRPATYGARYSALLANRVSADATDTVTIVGRYCESGDVIVKDAALAEPGVGDIVAIPASGAYHLSMASQYNMSPRPAVVVISDGSARLVRRRETYEDLLQPELLD